MKLLGIIACGDVAFRTYIPGVLPHADRATVTATFDPIQERAERAAAIFPDARAYVDFDAFLAHAGMDGVFNLTPAPLHATINQRSLAAGLHVFSEKPIAASVAEGQDLARQAAKAGLLLLGAPATMVTDRFQWLNTLITAGQLGRLTVGAGQMVNMGPAAWRDYTGDPSVFYSTGVGPVLDTAVYVLHGLTGLYGPALRVEAFGGIAIPERVITIPRLLGQRIEVGARDIVMIHLDFGENKFAQVLSSFAVPASQAPAMEIHGSHGSVSIPMATWYDSAGGFDLFRLEDSAAGASGWTRDIVNPAPAGPKDEHLIGAGPRHFIDCLTGASQPILTAEHAIHVLEIILAADRSAAGEGVIALKTTF